MNISALAVSAQREAESMMVDTCIITRASPTPTSNVPLTVYSGKCLFKIESKPRFPTDEQTGTSMDRDRTICKIPVSVEDVQYNDKVTCTASGNPSLVGDDFHVIGLFGQTAGSAQRLSCERVLR